MEWDESRLRVPAAVLSLAIMALIALVLLQAPMARLAPARSQEQRLRLEFVARPQADAPTHVPAPARAAARATAAPSRPSPPVAAHQRPPATIPPPLATPQATAPADPGEVARAVYDRDGRAKLPPGVVAEPGAPQGSPPGLANARDAAKTKALMERPNPVQYNETRFEKDWVSKGTLGDVATQKVNRAIADMFKSGRSSPTARPPPDTRFNPALAQNRGDLGSEATGDAYKAAPIAFEKAPQPTGEATKAIRAQLDALQGRALMCHDPRKDQWLADVRSNLQALERSEHALANGADPARAKYQLPQAIDAAYDLSRRALWYADKQLSGCGKAG
ncbi:hypothetical protein [Pseudoxanthomonas sp. X-1]|uniref:hypothetical protein n=2 Tax=Pseudoxanthomonas sp. X-1 TaxID=2571115 RepID=UPI001CC747AF|nr:hypothetical protein [Pseudoxanthomonas sp. X-1]UAY74290.1 hypothetical protein LAJ50_17770 [Pseudoxanthomonas sp. X-1]